MAKTAKETKKTTKKVTKTYKKTTTKKKASKKTTKKKQTAKTVYNKYNRIINKDEGYVSAKSALDSVEYQINKSNAKINSLLDVADALNEKMLSGNYNPEDIINSLPIESINDLYNPDERFTFKDILEGFSIRKQISDELDAKEEFDSKIKLMKIDVLEKKIEAILKNT